MTSINAILNRSSNASKSTASGPSYPESSGPPSGSKERVSSQSTGHGNEPEAGVKDGLDRDEGRGEDVSRGEYKWKPAACLTALHDVTNA